jgi:GalNAc5-diNAcBac-PP-undecaprenol beta-1,3-glucosyltransferase
MRATVVIPTHNHGRLLLSAVRSVLHQSLQEFELFIIGDGVTKETREAVEEALSLDKRARFFDQPKSPRTGEPYRHIALAEATGDIVCYLSDDDLWLPNHLETCYQWLQRHDVVHSLCCWVKPDGTMSASLIDWALPEWVKWTLAGQNLIGLSFVGHTMEFYRRLPHGWRSTPAGRPTDHYMWEQLLSVPGVRAACTRCPSVICFPAARRVNWTLERREKELLDWERKIDEPAKMLEAVWPALSLNHLWLKQQLERLQSENEHLQHSQQAISCSSQA